MRELQAETGTIRKNRIMGGRSPDAVEAAAVAVGTARRVPTDASRLREDQGLPATPAAM